MGVGKNQLKKERKESLKDTEEGKKTQRNEQKKRLQICHSNYVSKNTIERYL